LGAFIWYGRNAGSVAGGEEEGEGKRCPRLSTPLLLLRRDIFVVGLAICQDSKTNKFANKMLLGFSKVGCQNTAGPKVALAADADFKYRQGRQSDK
jgi:hypothetical protein